MSDTTAKTPPLIAAIDLGSNSFHMVLARTQQEGIRILDRMGEKVQLAAGLDANRHLTPEAMERGLDCLRRFAQLVNPLPEGSVRVVATNALRIALNRAEFIRRAEEILNHQVEVVSGREEARLIYTGVANTYPGMQGRRLVIDIGGGSTEFIIGEAFEPLVRESQQMGCVSYSQRFFSEGLIQERAYQQAYTAARLELMGIEQNLREHGWQEAVGSSGTIRAVGFAAKALGVSNGEITPQAISAIKRELFALGHVDLISWDGIKPDRRSIFPAGLAILEAVFDALEINQLNYCDSALREGVLYDLVGRHHHDDVREHTLDTLMTRYRVDRAHARRVEHKAQEAFEQVKDDWGLHADWHPELLSWAARVHEIGLDVAHYHYHKHGAYLIEHSDLPGFSKQDQQMLAVLVRGHRRNIPQQRFDEISNRDVESLTRLCILLRFAILFHHIRGQQERPTVRLHALENTLSLHFPEGWLAQNPLTQADFEAEAGWLARIGYELTVQ